jgi:hypothetical protein
MGVALQSDKSGMLDAVVELLCEGVVKCQS